MKKTYLFTGAQSTGKTTLINTYIEEVNEKPHRFPGITRDFVEHLPKFPINKETNELSQISITATLTNYIINNLGKFTFSDRSLIDTFAYGFHSDVVTKDEINDIIEIFRPILDNPNIVHIYTPIEFNCVNDGLRDLDETYRRKIDDFIHTYLKHWNIKYYKITGTVEQRVKRLHQIIDFEEAEEIRTSHEVPLDLLEVSREFNDYDYCLHHLNSNEVYRDFYKKAVNDGREVYLDNSAYELHLAGVEFNIDEFWKDIHYITPSVVIIPDVIGDKDKTIAAFKDFNIDELDLSTEIMGVAQGTTIDELEECYDFLANKCDIVALTFHSDAYAKLFPELSKSTANTQGRIYFLEKLIKAGKVPKKSIHLIGMSTVHELEMYKSRPEIYSYIRSIDTASPIQYGLLHEVYNDVNKNIKPNYVMTMENILKPTSSGKLSKIHDNVMYFRDKLNKPTI